MKKIISVILSLIILISSFSVCSFAIDYDWLENDSTFTNYNELLYDIYYNTYKYCELCESYNNNRQCTSHYFAVEDLNGDGVDELVVQFLCDVMAAQYMGVWTYDSDDGRVKFFNLFGELTQFYTTGYIQVPYSHNHSSGFTIWPYDVYELDFDTKEMIFIASAYCVDLELFNNAVDYSEYEDVDDDGVLYFFNYEYEEDAVPLTYTEFIETEELYCSHDTLIHLEYYEFSEDSIDNIEADYGSDLPVNGTMTGDVNGDNKVTAADARSVLRFAAKLDELTEEQQNLADVDMSGRVTAADARKILRVAAKLDEFDTPEPDVTPDPPVTTVPDFVYDKESYYGLYVDDAANVTPYFDSKINYEAESEYSRYIVFYTDSTITDFCFLDISADVDEFPYGNTVFTENRYFGELSADCPIVIKMQFGEILPVHGISFTDADGVYHVYELCESGEDGSVYLVEF